LTKTIALDGDGSWDYLVADSAARRLYVTHASEVVVLDIDSGAVLGRVTGLEGVHGVAIDASSGRGFASNGRTDSIVVFDLQTLAVIDELPAGDNPDAIIFDPLTKHVFAFNHSGGDVTVINAADGDIVATTALGGVLEYAVADGKGSIFANVEDTGEIVRIDASSVEVQARWPLAPCEEPTGIAMDQQGRRLFSTCGNGKLMVVDADNGNVVADVPIGEGCDGVRFDPETRLIFTSNGEGTLSIIHQLSANSYQVIETIATKSGARTLEIDLPTHKVFTARAQRASQPAADGGRPPIVANTFEVLEFSNLAR
jgi:DNA-binding beta-propeller fold protein YncE